MTSAEIEQIVAWARAEGWGPSDGDAQAFGAADPGGFLCARMAGHMVSGISAINWGPGFAFLGLFITAPQWRSRGIGGQLMQAALDRAGDRVIGLDGVAEQVPYYARLGFALAHWHVRYATAAGSVQPLPVGDVAGSALVPGSWELLPAALDYDAQLFAGDRREFLARWLDPSSRWRSWLAAVDGGGKLVGYGAIRQAPPGFKVGPLQADNPQIAGMLFDQLAAGRPGPVLLDLPDVNHQAVALAEERGMSAVFRCARMYRGAAPQLPLQRSYGVCTLELG